MATFKKDFWSKLSKLGIYSVEADGEPLLADQMDSGTVGGANSSDAKEKAPETNEQNNDDTFGDDMGMGGDDLTAGSNELADDSNTESADGDPMGDEGGGTEQNPGENPFKATNGRALLDSELAELQTAVTDTLERVYAKPELDQVVVSELENLADSIRNIRENVFLVSVDDSLYKYGLSVITYKQLSDVVCTSLKKNNK